VSTRSSERSLEMLVSIVGRGHSGTRLMAHTLLQSGFYIGRRINGAGDLIPAEEMYEAARIFGNYVDYMGNYYWSWERSKDILPTTEFRLAVEDYLYSVLVFRSRYRGWKLPENSLILPWLVKLYPRAYYIYWIRDPRDVVLDLHITDDIRKWNVPAPDAVNTISMRAISWWYQYQLAHSIIKPTRWIIVRYEDFVLKQDITLERLSDFLHIKLTKINVDPSKIGQWRTKMPDVMEHMGFLQPALNMYYEDY